MTALQRPSKWEEPQVHGEGRQPLQEVPFQTRSDHESGEKRGYEQQDVQPILRLRGVRIRISDRLRVGSIDFTWNVNARGILAGHLSLEHARRGCRQTIRWSA